MRGLPFSLPGRKASDTLLREKGFIPVVQRMW